MKARVLIIDDEPEIRRNLTIGLTQEDYGVVACPDGLSAIHELQAARERGIGFDYLVTDIFMPDIDGLKILKVVKNRFPDLPVLVITGFGDERLRLSVLSEHNTGYLDKPFEIPDLVAALEELSRGQTTLVPETSAAGEEELDTRESVSAYLMLRITDPERSMDIFSELYSMEEVRSCDAVRGDVDIILLAQATSQEGIDRLFERVAGMDGVEIASASRVEKPKLDREVNEFVEVYQKAVKQSAREDIRSRPGTTSYIIVDIDKHAIQQIFTTVFFTDEVVFCDVIDGGTRLVGMITGQGAMGRTPKVIEKLSRIDGVLRVRKAMVIKLMKD